MKPAVSAVRRNVFASSLVLAAIAAAELAGQGQGAAPRALQSFTSTSTAILVDVVVRDNHGRPVTDLSASDFDIAEDGVRQKIDSFSRVSHGGGIGVGVAWRAPPRDRDLRRSRRDGRRAAGRRADPRGGDDGAGVRSSIGGNAAPRAEGHARIRAHERRVERPGRRVRVRPRRARLAAVHERPRAGPAGGRPGDAGRRVRRRAAVRSNRRADRAPQSAGGRSGIGRRERRAGVRRRPRAKRRDARRARERAAPRPDRDQHAAVDRELRAQPQGLRHVAVAARGGPLAGRVPRPEDHRVLLGGTAGLAGLIGEAGPRDRRGEPLERDRLRG